MINWSLIFVYGGSIFFPPPSFFFFKQTVVHFKNYLFILWLHWVFVPTGRPSPVAASGGYSLVAVHRLIIAVVSLAVGHRL